MSTPRSLRNFAVAIVIVFVAGCTSPKSEPRPESTLPSQPTLSSLPPVDPGLPPLPNGTLPFIQFSGCTEILMAFEVPLSQVEAVVPKAFKPWGLTDSTAHVSALGYDCARAVDNRTVHGPVRTFWTVAFADPINRSWQQDGFLDYYVLDYVVDSRPFADALGKLGLAVTVGAFSVEKSALPNGVQAWNWNVDFGSGRAAFHHRLHSENPQTNKFAVHWWFGNGPYHRVNANETYTVDTLTNAGDIVLDGSSRLREALGAPSAPWNGSSFINATWTLEVSQTEFK